MSTSKAVHRIRFPDGTEHPVPDGTTVRHALAAWQPERAATYLAATLDGRPVDLETPLGRSGLLVPLTFDDKLGREILQHSAAHVVAKALTLVEPGALPTVGPPTDEGFYYDFDVRPLTPDDQKAVEAAVARIVAAAEPFRREEIDHAAAVDQFRNNHHKIEYIEAIPEGEKVSTYRTGDWVDLCRGPHVPDTSWLGGLHLLGFSAVTSEERHGGGSFQRIRGVAFPTASQLREYLKLRKEAEARDHRVLGAKLELFTFHDDVPGFPFWLPKGMIVIRELERFVTEHLGEAGYSEVRTPLLFSSAIYETSGHWENFRENMFLLEVDGRPYGIKPMNCPGSMLIFGSRARSYRELPMRLAEFAPLHRLEPSGTLHGLTRVRELVQDDAHLFVTEEQVETEIATLLAWIDRAFSTFRLSWSYELSTRPAKFLGEPVEWDRAEAALERCLKASKVAYKISPGEGGFYAPKIDIHIRDSLGRPWQTGTIQLDYQMPKRFRLQYQGADGQLHIPIVIHRTILGTWERFLGVLLEHTNGRLPPWLAPVQLRVLPVTDVHVVAAKSLVEEFVAAHVRAELAPADETLGKRVRAAELERVPYVAVVGDQEVANHTVALRVRGEKAPLTLSRVELLGRVLERLKHRSFDP
ncbi:MAG: threonine--tRNA ligase [Thermoplasmata archaeon]|nr:threonine--tRNA ligase [Thermoplasmata archaeon]